jgi:glycosyltransferase involved in cell wall biosynthesis
VAINILHVIPSLSIHDGGPSFAVASIARELKSCGVRVDIATTGAQREQKVDTNDLRVFSFARQTRAYKISIGLRSWLARNARNYDLIHIHALFSYSSHIAASCARRNRVPYIIRPLGVLNSWGMLNRRRTLKQVSFKLIENRILSGAAAVHYTSQQEKAEAARLGVTTPSYVIPLGFDFSEFRALPTPERFFERFPFARGRDVVLFLSRLDPKKGLDVLLRAFADARRLRPTMLLAIAGDGDPHFVKALRELADELRIAQDVVWTGFLSGEEKLAALSAARVFALPSSSENFGIALAEALAAGLPCVLSDQIGIADDVTHYNAGLVCPADVRQLTTELIRLLDDASLRRTLGANAKRLVADKYSSVAMGKSLVAMYNTVLSEHRQTSQHSADLEAAHRNATA